MELKLDFEQEIYLENLDKLIVIFSRIFDEVFLRCQLNNLPYPLIKIEQIKTQLHIGIFQDYQPSRLNIFECEERIKYYQGSLSLVNSKSKTCWILDFSRL